MEVPCASVIVPVYKTERYIDQCVRSIMNQTYKNLEIILVDDGSPDNCGKICDECAKQDSRIRVIHKENGGLSDARNAGIEIATGDYVTFVDSDDYLALDMIERLMEVIVNEKVDIAQCGFVRCQKEDNTIEQTPYTEISYALFSSDRMTAYLRDNKIATAAWGKIYNISLFQNIRFPYGRLHEDVFTTYKLIHEARAVAVANYVGYVYRINKESITGSSFSPKKLDSIYGELERAEFVDINYPLMRKYAYIGIIYTCNRCLWQMSVTDYSDGAVLAWIQKLYRRYGRYYLAGNVSLKGKIVTLASMANVRLGRLICRAAQRK